MCLRTGHGTVASVRGVYDVHVAVEFLMLRMCCYWPLHYVPHANPNLLVFRYIHWHFGRRRDAIYILWQPTFIDVNTNTYVYAKQLESCAVQCWSKIVTKHMKIVHIKKLERAKLIHLQNKTQTQTGAGEKENSDRLFGSSSLRDAGTQTQPQRQNSEATT